MISKITRRGFLSSSLLAAGALGLRPIWGVALPSRSGTDLASNLFRPVDFSQVTITDGFWKPKMDKVATATLRACIVQTEEKTPRIRNFEKVARKQGEKHEGIYYDDSDVYKALEAIAYSLKNRPDAALEKKADEWIDKIAAAQLPDGYLNTYFTLRGLDGRWTDMEKHEDYCAGHLIEAAVAYFRTTGKRKLLDVAIRLADHIDTTFRLADRHWVSGHEEIELALVKLYHLTDNDRYIKLADWYLGQRGRRYGKGALWGKGQNPDYCQDGVPVKDQREITGHAVRAMYLYTGAADVAAVTGDTGYMQAMKAVWEDVVYRNLYVTGGIGSSGRNEGFTEDYDLPNSEAYCETCASVGMVLWNQRMNLMTGESRYIDVLERSLYNGALDGLSLTGDRFFYGNPLASTAQKAGARSPGRREWFGTACCPSNIARLVASLGGYLYGVSDTGIWVNLFVSSTTNVKAGRSEIALRVESEYPWNGRVRLAVDPTRKATFAIHLRIPGWARNVAVPGDLYRFTDKEPGGIKVLLNGKPVRYREEKGYAVLERGWKRGDVVELNLPMPVRQVAARPEVKADNNRRALQRGPLVYCVEGADNANGVWDFVLNEDESFVAQQHKILDESVVALTGQVRSISAAGHAPVLRKLTAIPYYTWANRNNYEMQVWLPIKPNDPETTT
ncbi:glycoside hydrolase family 127 protein [soil metagenome]